jgi:hypothetical protein
MLWMLVSGNAFWHPALLVAGGRQYGVSTRNQVLVIFEMTIYV